MSGYPMPDYDSTGHCPHGVSFRSTCEQCREDAYAAVVGPNRAQRGGTIVDTIQSPEKEEVCIHGTSLDSLCSKCLGFEGWISTCETCNGEGYETACIADIVVGRACIECNGRGTK